MNSFQAYRWIKRNRLIKKVNLYKLALGVAIDRTIAIYSVAFSLYFIIGSIVAFDGNEFFKQQWISQVEHILVDIYPYLPTFLPILFIFSSFRDPGILFARAEYQLTWLPYSKNKIWLWIVLEKWGKQLLISISFTGILLFFTPISSFLIVKYSLTLYGMVLLMTIPQWVLFQKHFFNKLLSLLLALSVFLCMVYLNLPALMSALYPFVWFILTIYWIKRGIFRNVLWDRVVEVSDFRIWSMFLISKLSKVDMKRERNFRLLHILPWRKRPFVYTSKKIHHRLWSVYFRKNLRLLLQTILSISLLYVIFLFQSEQFFYLAIAIGIYIYTRIGKIFFETRFKMDILEGLPWDLKAYKKSFFQWFLFGGLVLLIPFIFLLITAWSRSNLLAFFYALFLMTYMYHLRIDEAIYELGRKSKQFTLRSILGTILFVGFILNAVIPNDYYLIIGICAMIFVQRRKTHFFLSSLRL